MSLSPEVQKNNPTLIGLPRELQIHIASYLPDYDKLNLITTSRSFISTLSLEDYRIRDKRAGELADLSDVYPYWAEDRYPCYCCLKILPKDMFCTIEAGIPGHNLWRSCLDCAAAKRKYQHLQPLSNGKLDYYFCHNCGRYGTASTRCRGPTPANGNWREATPQMLALCRERVPPTRAPMEKLPSHLLKKIVEHLGYNDGLRLACVSKTLRSRIEVQNWIPIHKIWRFLQERYSMVPRPRSASKCIICYTIQDNSKFTSMSLEQARQSPHTRWMFLRYQRCSDRLHHFLAFHQTIGRYRPLQTIFCNTCGCIGFPQEPCGGCIDAGTGRDVGVNGLPRETRQILVMQFVGYSVLYSFLAISLWFLVRYRSPSEF